MGGRPTIIYYKYKRTNTYYYYGGGESKLQLDARAEHCYGSGGESQLQLDARAAHGFGGGEVSMEQEAAAGYTGTTDTIRALLQKLQRVVTLDEIYTACLSKPFGKEEKMRVAANVRQMKDVEREGRGLYKLKK